MRSCVHLKLNIFDFRYIKKKKVYVDAVVNECLIKMKYFQFWPY